ncbi:hypothetical protein ACOSQ4_031450 [Xanthoceras sorbifolium]
MDVKNAFLNGDLEEEVYMEIPLGLKTKRTINKMCRLHKSLYGLKQSPRAWFDRFTKVVKKVGFNKYQTDHTLFVKHSSDGRIAILIVYVNDIILTNSFDEEIPKLFKFFSQGIWNQRSWLTQIFSWYGSCMIKEGNSGFIEEVCP